MIIKSIRLMNFGVYAGEHEIQPVSSQNGVGPCITLIGGMNGGGKTSLLDAVLLALYGAQSPSARDSGRSYSAYLESLINRTSGRNVGSSAELTFELPSDRGTDLITLRRSWRLANVRVVEHLDISRNGQEDTFLAEAWDSYVEELIPSGLAGLFFFDGEKIGALAEAEETPDSVQRAIRSMLGLDLVDRLVADLATVMRRAQARSNDASVREAFTEAEMARSAVTSHREQLNQEVAKLNSELARAEDLLKRRQEEYLRAGGAIASNRSSYADAQEEIRNQHAEARAGLVTLAAGALPLLLVQELLKQAGLRIKADDDIRQAKAALPVVTKHAEVLADLAAKVEDARVRNALLQEISQSLGSLHSLAGADVLFPISPAAISQLEELNASRFTTLRQEAAVGLTHIREVALRRDQLERHLNAEVDEEAVAANLRELSEAAERIAGLKHQLSSRKEALRQLDFELHQIEGRVSKSADKLVHVEESARIAQYAGKSREVMMVFRERLAAEKIAQLTRLIAEAFAELTHKTTLAHSVRLDPETLKISLLDSRGFELPKSRLSSGEKQMLAVAILWGLAKASGRKLPVIVDTPMGRLDSSHRMNFVARYLPAASHQVIVLSTDTEIVGRYLDRLSASVGREYLLSYDDTKQQTTVLDGYFATEGGVA